MDIHPLAGALGAEIRGVNLLRMDDAGWRDVHKAFLEYSVLAIRDQKLEPADLMKVGQHFGEPCHYPFVTGLEGFPYIFEVVKAEEEKTNFGGNWHSDTTYLKQPPLATLLYAVELEAARADRLDVLRPRIDQRHVMPQMRQRAADIAAERSRSHHRDSFGHP